MLVRRTSALNDGELVNTQTGRKTSLSLATNSVDPRNLLFAQIAGQFASKTEP
jgi:hypothetical protein